VRSRRFWRDVAVLVVWLAAVAALAIGDDSGIVYSVVGSILTIAVGAVIDRFWVLVVPTIVAALLIVPFYVASGDCFSCGDDGWNLVTWVAILVFVLPATVALGIGVLAGTVIRAARRADDARQAPPRSPRRAPRAP
jgi:hypothetical protein